MCWDLLSVPNSVVIIIATYDLSAAPFSWVFSLHVGGCNDGCTYNSALEMEKFGSG